MERQIEKVARLEAIEHLLLQNRDGLTISEIARHIGVNRSTVWRYVNDGDLPAKYYEVGPDKRIRILTEHLHFNIKLDLNEALAIYLAVRLFSTRMDRHNPSAATAIRKISQKIEGIAAPISEAMARSANRADGEDQIQDRDYIEVLKILTRAWASLRQVRLVYASDSSGEDHEYTFCPYFIEPYAIGQTTYAIGRRVPAGDMRTFKIERIRSACLLPEHYQIPADFDIDAYLADAWGIWTCPGEPAEVVLRFSARVAQRVLETRWHRSQKCEQQADGSVIWQARIAEPREMMPWIRGWGEDVEILKMERAGEPVAV